MTDDSSSQVFALDMDLSRYEAYSQTNPPSYDAVLAEFPDQASFQENEYDNLSRRFWQPQTLNFPDGIQFRGIIDFLDLNHPTSDLVTDWPWVRENWPIMSQRMLEVLLSVQPFPHQVIPVTMLPNDRESTVAIDDYVAVQLLEHVDVFDWDHSVYEINPNVPNIPQNIKYSVFKEPEAGFPPLFRDATKPTRLYVSAAARAALEAAEIKGVRFSSRKLTTLPWGQAFITPDDYPDVRVEQPRLNRDRAYRLLMDFSRYEGYVEAEILEHTVWLTDFPEIERYRQPSPCPECQGPFWQAHPDLESLFWQPQELDLPERIEFTAVFDSLRIDNAKFKRATDYPDIEQKWPIMSKRMLNALLSVRPFPHQAIPIVIRSAQVFTTATGTVRDDRESHDYVAVQLLEQLDILDWEQSSNCTRCPEHPEFMDNFSPLTKMVLTEPPEGFPPLFRITAKPMFLFVSAAGMAAMQAAGIQGIDYVSGAIASN